MTDAPLDLSLFGEDSPPAETVAPASAPAAIAEWQMDLLRKALDARGVTEMSERQALVVEAAGRPLASLRDLTSEEANAVLVWFGRTPPAQGSDRSASLWEPRDGDTWIDRL